MTHCLTRLAVVVLAMIAGGVLLLAGATSGHAFPGHSHVHATSMHVSDGTHEPVGDFDPLEDGQVSSIERSTGQCDDDNGSLSCCGLGCHAMASPEVGKAETRCERVSMVLAPSRAGVLLGLVFGLERPPRMV